MSNTNTSTAVNVADLSAEQIASLLDQAPALRAQIKDAKKIQGKRDRLAAMRDGVVGPLNPKGHHNPALLVETLRQAEIGEEIGGSEAHGWVVAIACLDCSARVLINTQDAFQKRRCGGCQAEARKTKVKAKRAGTQAAKLAADPSQLAALLEAAKAAGLDLSSLGS